MRITTGFLIPFIIFGSIAVAQEAQAEINITVAGSWLLTIDATDLVDGAGTGLIDTYENIADAVSISISGTTGASDTWRVDVKKVDTDWYGSFHLYVQRTSEGTGGSVSGGAAYQEITDMNQSFFDGSDDVSGIGIQLKLSGVSVQIPPDTYATTVYYTVVDI
jgi:hypothetical protein